MDDNIKINNTHQKEFICKGCAAKLYYSPGTQSLGCEYCGASNEIPTDADSDPVVELDLEQHFKNLGNETPTIDLVVVKCHSCSAQTTFEPNLVSHFCSFCGSPIVVTNATTQHTFKPKGVLPFSITKNAAFDAYNIWLNNIWWAPFGFKKNVQANNMLTGMYIPYWTYDASTATDYIGERGDDYTTIESYTTVENGKTVTRQRPVTHTRWTNVWGDVTHAFDDVLVNASNSLPRDKAELLEPWDLGEIKPFNEAYLSGFRTECYQIDVKAGFDMAKGRMKDHIEMLIKQDIGGDHQRVQSLETHYSNLTFKHILLPIWINTYRYNNKPFNYLVNGRTGEVQGKYPVSKMKIALVIIAVAVVAGLIFLNS